MFFFGTNAANRPPPRNRRPGSKDKSNREMPKATQIGMFRLQPNFTLETPRLHSGAACDRQETTETPKTPPIPEVV